MATKTTVICDRCKKEIVYKGWTAKIKGLRRIFIRKLLNGNPNGYSYNEYNVELCHDCIDALEKFLRNESEED